MDTMNGKKIEAIAFTSTGENLAEKLMGELGGNASRSGRPDSLKTWLADRFDEADALVFIGATGIAVRAIAPYIESKAKDPAVVVTDEKGRFVIPLLSGHLGGANELAKKMAKITGGEAVITTATDVQGVFAVDEWTRKHNCSILETDKIKNVSSTLLSGGVVTIRSPWAIKGKIPPGCILTEADEADIAIDVRVKGEKPLHVIPKICTLGVGCRRGTSATALEHFLQKLLMDTDVHEEAINAVATIDIKADEPGLKEFCEKHGWELKIYSAPELEKVPGKFSRSKLVSKVTGVDNVCERSAVLASGGELIHGKTAGDGITMAIAMKDYKPDWRWLGE